MTRAIERVEAEWANKDPLAALAVALEEWKQTRDASIASAIDAIAAKVAPFDAPKVRTNKQFQIVWLELVASEDAAAVPWLAEHLRLRMPRNEPDELFVERLAAIRAHPDPRYADALMSMIKEGLDIIRWCREGVDETLAVSGDGRTRQELLELAKLADDAGRAELEALVARLPEIKPVADADVVRWGAFAPARARGADDVDLLMKAVQDEPSNLEARTVLADALLEAGDPRGEFIVLQFAEAAGKGTRETATRAGVLLKKHLKAWLGPLHSVVYRGQFRHGFLDEVELEASRRASKKAWEAHSRDPQLATVRRLTGGRAPVAIVAQFVASPAMRSLEAVTVNANPIADALLNRPPEQLREVRSHAWSRASYAKQFHGRVLPLLELLPALDTVGCSEDMLEAVVKSPAFSRVTSLAVSGELAGGKARELLVGLPEHVTTLDLHWTATDPMLELLSALPEHITSIRIDRHAWLERASSKLTLRIEVRSRRVLEKERNPYGLPALLPRLSTLDGLKRIEVETFTDTADLSLFEPSDWSEGIELEVREAFESGLTREFAS